MKTGTFIGLSVATVVAVAAAVAVTSGRNEYQAPPGAGIKAFPGLIDAINEVSAISIERAGEKLSIVRYPDRWGEEQRSGYPVRTGAVRKFLLELTQLEQTDPKTRLKKNHGRLELGDPAEEGAKSKKVALKDKNGKVLSSLIIGKRMRSLEGGSGVYIRKPDSDQTWLSRSAITVSLQAADWLETEIIDINPKQVRKIVIRHPDGETLTVSKASATDAHYVIKNLPPKAKLKSEFAADALASALDGLKLDDVAKASAMTFSKDSTVNVKITTFDGLRVALDVLKLNGEYWIKMAAAAKDGSDQAEKAGKLNARAEGWAYRVAAYKTMNLNKRLSDFLKKEKSK